jgi:hypothetical protein
VLQKVSQAQYIVDDGIIKLPHDVTTKLFATDPAALNGQPKALASLHHQSA